MKTHKKEIILQTYSSDVLPDIVTEDPNLARTIEFADANPWTWKIVTTTRSKAYGRGSTEYIGWAQKSMAPEAILERARHFHCCIDPGTGGGSYVGCTDIWGWRARFTFEHFDDKGFSGGYFQRLDGRSDRESMTMDYTVETLPQVVRNFMQWALTPPGTFLDGVKLDGGLLSEEILEAARRLSTTIWDPPGEFFTSRGLTSSIQ